MKQVADGDIVAIDSSPSPAGRHAVADTQKTTLHPLTLFISDHPFVKKRRCRQV